MFGVPNNLAAKGKLPKSNRRNNVIGFRALAKYPEDLKYDNVWVLLIWLLVYHKNSDSTVSLIKLETRVLFIGDTFFLLNSRFHTVELN